MDQESLLNNVKMKLSFENSIFTRPNIPKTKLTNAIKSYGNSFIPNEVILLLDDTLFGGAKEGLMITNDSLAIKVIFEKPCLFNLKEIKEINFSNKKMIINNFVSFQFMSSDSVIKKLTNIIKESLGLASETKNITNNITSPKPNLYHIEATSTKLTDYNLPNFKYSDTLMFGYQPHFKSYLEAEDEITEELITFYLKIYSAILNLHQSHRRHHKFKEELAPIYESDEAMCFMLFWCTYCLNRILHENDFNDEVIKGLTIPLSHLVDLLIEYIDFDHFDKLSSKGNPQKAYENSKVARIIQDWAMLLKSYASGLDNPLEDDFIYSELPGLFFYGLKNIYPKLNEYLEESGVDMNTENGHMVFFIDFTKDLKNKMETYLNQLF